ncbi:MAG: glycosyl transferase [Cyclobacteriaceae bacterium]|nr:glycosyl transferase [Cyclobacteriaceae bacterium]
MTKRVLIITYYWPPSGGSGVQRWLKFVKYLPQFGWEPFVFTPENPAFSIQDKSLLNDVPAQVEVVRFPIWEPYQLFQRLASFFSGKKMQPMDLVATGRKTFIQKFGMWIRANFFIPDARRFWIKPSVEYLSDFVQRNQIDKIITTGPPHSMHLIGRNLKRKNQALHWVADFRDPWSEWDLLDTLRVSGWARNKHKRMEASVLREADRVLTVTPYYVKQFKHLGAKSAELITNGFDEDDFKSIQHHRTASFTVRHMGGVDELRDPRPVMVAIKNLCLLKPDFREAVKVEFIGTVNSSFKEFVANDEVLAACVNFMSHIPHNELMKTYETTDLLLLILAHAAHAKGNIPGKLFEYLASGNEVLGVGASDGDSAKLLTEAGAGSVVDASDQEGLETALWKSFLNWKAGAKPDRKTITEYSRRVLTMRLVTLLEQLP